MIEFEQKYRVSDPKRLRELLINNGFIKKSEELNEDTYYTDKQRSFIKDEVCLRIRNKKDQVIFTFKPKTNNPNDIGKEEIELKIENKELMNQALIGLGYVQACSFTKKRDKYRRGKLEVCVDYIDGLGWFTELEVMDLDETHATKIIQEAANELQLTNREQHNYRDLVLIRDGQY